MDLPHNLVLYFLLLAALAIGFLLGRREKRPGKSQAHVIKDYYQGLNFLLGERPELGVDRFIQAMEVSDETIDVHLALGGVVRRRGEVDKAIRIHQNLLANPSLSTANKHLVEFELARDYHTAGLLDRAEGLLVKVVARRDAQYPGALQLLIDLYEQERDWAQAIELSEQIPAARRGEGADNMAHKQSHFHCELAQQALDKGNYVEATGAAKRAMQIAPHNPRGYCLAAQVSFSQAKYKVVLRHLSRALELQPALSEQILPLYAQTCERMGTQDAYRDFLQRNLARAPTGPMFKAWAELRQRNGEAVTETDIEALVERVAASPDDHIDLLVALLAFAGAGMQGQIRQLLQDSVATHRSYQCRNCGFRSNTHAWHCPTCKQWGTFAA